MKAPLHIRELNKAREWYNPLRGLDVQRVARLLEEGERGNYAALQKLFRMAEKRFATLKALKDRRLGALKKLDWDVKIVAEIPRGFTEAQAKAQAQVLSDAYYAIENLPQAFEHLALATFRGYSHLEPRHQDNDATLPVTQLVPVPQWHWFRDDQSWHWRYDPEAQDQLAGSTEVDVADFIIREVDAPLNEIGLLCFIRANMSAKDWDAFCEDYNIPSLFFALGENTPMEQVKEWLKLAEQVTKNSRGALPPGSEILKVEVGNPDGKQFQAHMEWQQRELVLAGTGGLLTMLAESGSGTLAGSAHQEAFDLLAIAEAMEISAVLQAQFDKPLLKREFPSQPVLAYFELAAEDTEDLDKLADRLAKLKNAGFEADEEEISEKFGLRLKRVQAPAPIDPTDPNADPADNEPLKNRATGPAAAGRAARFEVAAERALADADRAVLQPIIDRVAPIRAGLARIADLDDEAFAAGMAALQPQIAALRHDLPALEEAVLTGRPDLEDAFTDIIGTAFLSGAAEAANRPSGKP